MTTNDKDIKKKPELIVPPLEEKPRAKIEIPAGPNIKTIASRYELTTITEAKEEGVLNVGDLVWVKVPGYPRWPAMISMDPVERIYTKRVGNNKVGYVYHVQYFGEKAGRNWTLPNITVTPFEGPELPVQQKRKKGPVIAKSVMKGHDYAIAEAVQALQWDRKTRVKHLTYEYVLVDQSSLNVPKTPTRKQRELIKRKSETSSADVYNFDESIDEFEQNSQPMMIWSRPRVEQSPVHNTSYQSEKDSSFEKDILASPKLAHEECIEDKSNAEEDETTKTQQQENEIKKSEKSRDEMDIDQNGDDQNSLTDSNKKDEDNKETKKVRSKTSQASFKEKSIKNAPTKQRPSIKLKVLPIKAIQKRPSSVTITKVDSPAPIKRNTRRAYSLRLAAKPSLDINSTKKSEDKQTSQIPTPTDDNDSTNSDDQCPPKRMRVDTKQRDLTTDDMTSSEDASSTSDLEAPDVRLDKLCNVCHETTGPFYFCSGTCLRTMHASCGGSESSSSKNNLFICQECKTSQHPCFVCKSIDGKTVKCCHKNCGKYYHLQCLNPENYPIHIRSENLFTCPMHYCLTCYTDQPFPREVNCLKPSKRQLVKCLSCPTAFHNDESCIAAGTVILEGNYVKCPLHRSKKNEKHINVSWCFSCNDGGNLICCESCPAAFHADCIDNPPENDDDNYFCYDCRCRKQLHYGDIIWIKLGSYRWWPARITHPNSVPENIMKLSHSSGEFPVYFFGSHDYFWSHRGRVFLFVDEDGQKGFGKAASSNKKFKVACEEARSEFEERKVNETERMEKIKKMQKPRFKLIKQNRPINNVSQSTADDKQIEVTRCECKPDGEVLCGTEDCLNRLMMLECSPSTCPVGDKCQNQRFKKRQYPIVVPFKTNHAGWGLRTTQDIKKGDFVIEYVGELIDEAECNKRMEIKIEKGDKTFYFLTIDKDRIIDADLAANHARFMNHSCQPNCETQKWVVNGQTKVGLFAIHDISAGTELTFNYNLDCRGNEKMECRCNSNNCSGFIGLPPKNIKNNNSR